MTSPAEIVTVELGGETFRLRWDFGAIAVFQREAVGANGEVPSVTVANLIHALYAAIAAYAFSRDEPVPITVGRLGSLLDSGVKVERAMKALNQIIDAYNDRTEQERGPVGKSKPAPGNGQAGSKPRTKSERSTSGSAKKSSGA